MFIGLAPLLLILAVLCLLFMLIWVSAAEYVNESVMSALFYAAILSFVVGITLGIIGTVNSQSQTWTKTPYESTTVTDGSQTTNDTRYHYVCTRDNGFAQFVLGTCGTEDNPPIPGNTP